MGLPCAVITLQIKEIRVAVGLFLPKFSNTEGHPYATVYSCWCLWTGWNTEMVSFVLLHTGEEEMKTRMCSPAWANVSAVSWSPGQFITALMSQVTISSQLAQADTEVFSLHRLTSRNLSFMDYVKEISVTDGFHGTDSPPSVWRSVFFLWFSKGLRCFGAGLPCWRVFSPDCLLVEAGASFWLLRSLGELPFCQSRCNSVTWKCSFRSEQRHIGLVEERLADAAPVLSAVPTQHLKLWRNCSWTNSERKNLFLNWDFNKQDWGLHVWKVCGNSSSRSICEFQKCLVTSAYNYAEIIFAKMFVFKLAGY